MKKMCILLVVMFLASVVQADLTALVGEDFAMVDLGAEQLGAFEFIASVGQDYFATQSQPFKNFELDTGDTYVGLGVKVHLLAKESEIDPYLALRSMSRNMTFQGNDSLNILGAGVNWKYFCVEYQYCANFKEDHRVMFGLVKQFK